MSGRALITGAEGFVGGILSEYLAGRGWDVRCGVLFGATDPERRMQCDITEADQVAALLEWAGPVTHVFHLAAIAFVPESMKKPSLAMRVNFEGTANLLHAVHESSPRARFVFVSSAEIYGRPRSLPITEEHPVNPENPYAISKAAADSYCGFFHKAAGLDIVCMRPFNHSGPGQSDQFVLSSFARQIARAEAGQAPPVVRVGNLAAARDFSHVRDVIRAYELAALGGKPGEAYNICAGASVSMRDALDTLIEMSTIEVGVETDPERLRSVDVPEVVGSHDKLTADTGWMPEVPFRDVLGDLLDYWRAKEAKAR